MAVHRLVRFDPDQPATVHLSESSAQELYDALAVLRDVYAIESYFDTAISNYVELESRLASTTVRLAFQSTHADIQQRHDLHLDISRSLSNTLSALREYRDRVGVVLSESNLQGARTCLDEEYARRKRESFAFECIEYLRNIGQHHTDPIKQLHLSCRFIRLPASTVLHEYYLEPQVDMRDFLTNARVRTEFKNKLRVYAKMQEHGADNGQEFSFDIRPLIRDCMEEWYGLHYRLRKHVIQRFDQCKALVDEQKAQLDLQQATPNDRVSEIVRYDDDETYIIERTGFDLGISTLAISLMKRNSPRFGPRHTFVSTGCMSRKQLYREEG